MNLTRIPKTESIVVKTAFSASGAATIGAVHVLKKRESVKKGNKPIKAAGEERSNYTIF
jgi:hypothetical protein